MLEEVGAETRREIQSFTDAAQQSAPSLARRELAGSDVGQRFLNQGQTFEQSLGGDVATPALSEAINRRALGQYGAEYGALKQKVDYKALNKKFERLSQAADLVKAENDHNERVRQARYQIKQQRKKARGAMLGSVLGIVGGVVGGIYGGPAGAQAGGMVGQTLGQNIGEG